MSYIDDLDLNDWQRAVYMAIAEAGPLTQQQIVQAIGLPAKEVRPIIEQHSAPGLIRSTDDGWRVT